MVRDAVISRCGTYRYLLTREWDPSLASMLWIMLNPSTADASVDDPTIRKCIGFAKKWCFGSITVVNLYALRATSPKELALHSHPCGPMNDSYIEAAFVDVGLVVAAWGTKGSPRRSKDVCAIAARKEKPLHHIGTLTKDGFPRHPLYVPYTALPSRWNVS